MTDRRNVVKVRIGGDEYTLRSDRSEEYTRSVAEYVDRTLREVQAGGTIVEIHKAAMLTALSVADELFQARQARTEMSQRLSALVTDLSRLLPPAKRESGGR
jgi:cell division protein ZapA